MTLERVKQLESEWTMYNCNGWIGIHKETKKKIKCGTYHALINNMRNNCILLLTMVFVYIIK